MSRRSYPWAWADSTAVFLAVGQLWFWEAGPAGITVYTWQDAFQTGPDDLLFIILICLATFLSRLRDNHNAAAAAGQKISSIFPNRYALQAIADHNFTGFASQMRFHLRHVTALIRSGTQTRDFLQGESPIAVRICEGELGCCKVWSGLWAAVLNSWILLIYI